MLAKMIAVPADSAVTIPLGDTDATVGAPLDQITVLPLSAWPSAPCATTSELHRLADRHVRLVRQQRSRSPPESA